MMQMRRSPLRGPALVAFCIMVFANGCRDAVDDLRGKWVFDADESRLRVPMPPDSLIYPPTIVLDERRFTILPGHLGGNWRTDGKTVWLTPDAKLLMFELLQYEGRGDPEPRPMIFTIADSGNQLNFAYRSFPGSTQNVVVAYRKQS